MVGTHFGSDIGIEEKLRVLEEVLRSETFARSERLKSLLRFLCEAEIEGREAELTEYNIGTMALGRPADFSPLEDSSVRSRAHELRQRLEKYYASEVHSTPVRIELRKGSYVPRFFSMPGEQETETVLPAPIPASAVPPAEPERAQQPAAARTSMPRQWRIGILCFAAGVATMLGALALWSVIALPGVRVPGTRLETSVSPSLWTPELEAIWKPFVGTRTPLMVAFETRFFVQMGPLAVRDWRVNNIGMVESSEQLMRLQKLFSINQLYPSGNYTDVGAPVAMFYLTRLLSTRVPLMSVRSSHEMTAPDLLNNNLILVGKPWTDPRIERVLAAADLVDANGKILNVRPAPGEPKEYKDVNDHTDPEGWNEKYSVITMMPSPAGGNSILALTGSGSEQPSALAYYLTDPDSARGLYRRLSGGTGRMPQYYQVLVKAEFKAKALVKVEYVAFRALRTPIPQRP